LKQFIRISEKIKSSYDTIIQIPSSNTLNNKFLYRLNNIIKCEHIIDNELFSKMYTEEVIDNVEFDKMTKEEGIIIKKSFAKMGDFFTFKEIPPKLRKYIKNIWNDNSSCDGLYYADKINGKNILVLDDTISSGQTISTYCENIISNYTPKSITIVTLFSKLT
jgi:adenine/guanine phosphoribosyltransferase-like PRPP-binding protein